MSNLAWDIESVLPATIADLHHLVSIPSVSSQPEHDDDVEECAQHVASLFEGAGCPEVRLLRAAGGKPAVYGHFPAPEGAPTVLLYAHYDVQPTGDVAQWSSEPFRADERDCRLYGRGTADDKGGVALHLAVLRMFEGRPPVGVKVFIEGEEEIGSPSMGALLDTYSDELTADIFVIADSVNWEVGAPSLTTTLRGVIDCEVTVGTLHTGLHSGQFGGVVPDALTALCRLMATLHDAAGDVAVKGLHCADMPALDYPEDRLLAETGLLDGVQQIGTGSAVQRMWGKAAISVLAIDTTRIADASNTLIPAARAKVSMRLAPGQDAEQAQEALQRHLEENAPWGAHVTVTPGQSGEPGIVPADAALTERVKGAFKEAFGVEAIEMGCGGSIPIVAEFAERNPGASVFVTAVTDPDSRMHGIDESLHMEDFARAALAEALMLTNLAAG